MYTRSDETGNNLDAVEGNGSGGARLLMQDAKRKEVEMKPLGRADQWCWGIVEMQLRKSTIYSIRMCFFMELTGARRQCGIAAGRTPLRHLPVAVQVSNDVQVARLGGSRSPYGMNEHHALWDLRGEKGGRMVLLEWEKIIAYWILDPPDTDDGLESDARCQENRKDTCGSSIKRSDVMSTNDRIKNFLFEGEETRFFVPPKPTINIDSGHVLGYSTTQSPSTS
ncbi:hypothetical protein DFH06DRAFT_1140709 [Mycena polygramma]|nr:hypothetical protein DFH06DRAFT_1140709 [Mycena polygramma]